MGAIMELSEKNLDTSSARHEGWHDRQEQRAEAGLTAGSGNM